MSKKTTMTNAAALATMQSQLAELAQKLLESEAKAAQMETERKAEQERLASLPPVVRVKTHGYGAGAWNKGAFRNGRDNIQTLRNREAAYICWELLKIGAVSLTTAQPPKLIADSYTRTRVIGEKWAETLPCAVGGKSPDFWHILHNAAQTGNPSMAEWRPIGCIEGVNGYGKGRTDRAFITADGMEWLASLGCAIDPMIRAKAEGGMVYFAPDGTLLPAPIQIPVVKAPVVEEKPVIKPSPRKRQPVKV